MMISADAQSQDFGFTAKQGQSAIAQDKSIGGYELMKSLKILGILVDCSFTLKADIDARMHKKEAVLDKIVKLTS